MLTKRLVADVTLEVNSNEVTALFKDGEITKCVKTLAEYMQTGAKPYLNYGKAIPGYAGIYGM
jgi:hypothetical protein